MSKFEPNAYSERKNLDEQTKDGGVGIDINDDFNQIIDYAHFWNWAPDWGEVQRIYECFPDSYSVLTPFAYSYLEEMIRTTTSDYGLPLFDQNKQPVTVTVGMKLIAMAIKENQGNQEYIKLLEETKKYFRYIEVTNDENGRNRVMHGFVHPRFWTKESFEQLIHHIAMISPHSRF